MKLLAHADIPLGPTSKHRKFFEREIFACGKQACSSAGYSVRPCPLSWRMSQLSRLLTEKIVEQFEDEKKESKKRFMELVAKKIMVISFY